MNLSGDMEDSSDKILFLNFNQDFSCVSVGTETGYRMYNCDPFGRCYSKCREQQVQCTCPNEFSFSFSLAGRGASIVEMLFCTSLVALVGVADQEGFNSRQLQIINTKVQGTFLSTTTTKNPSFFIDIYYHRDNRLFVN